MALLNRLTIEEKAAARASREQQREAEQRAGAQQQEEKRRWELYQDFLASPAGEARAAYERGDKLVQCVFKVRETTAVVVAMIGTTNTQRTSDPTMILNSVCNEGWDLVNGSFVFIELGQQSRDKFGSSGQNVATRGTVVGHYLFRRCEANKVQVTDPWNLPAAA